MGLIAAAFAEHAARLPGVSLCCVGSGVPTLQCKDNLNCSGWGGFGIALCLVVQGLLSCVGVAGIVTLRCKDERLNSEWGA